MKKYVLDYSTWRCGDDGKNKVGYGTTALLNKEGYMCCLGQFCIQEGAPKEKILGEGEPCELGGYDEYEDTRISYFEGKETPLNEYKFNNDAIDINDAKNTTPEYKINALKELCVRYGVELEVINYPPSTESPLLIPN